GLPSAPEAVALTVTGSPARTVAGASTRIVAHRSAFAGAAACGATPDTVRLTTLHPRGSAAPGPVVSARISFTPLTNAVRAASIPPAPPSTVPSRRPPVYTSTRTAPGAATSICTEPSPRAVAFTAGTMRFAYGAQSGSPSVRFIQ